MGLTGPAGPAGPAFVPSVYATLGAPLTSVNSVVATATATCLDADGQGDDILIGGGFQRTDNDDIMIVGSFMNTTPNPDQWNVQFRRLAGGNDVTLAAQAICLLV
jgi:hypothetical protein